MYEDLFDMAKKDEHKLPYVITGTVIMNYDPLHPASVQVSIPDRPKGMNVTAWARVIMPFAGSGQGAYSLPNIGDEVALAFCNGEIDSPVVIGCLHSLTKMPPTEALNPLNTVKCIKTGAGHIIKMDDTPGQTGIEIKTATGISLTMKDVPPSITLKDTASNSITIDGAASKITVDGKMGATVKSGACEISVDGTGQKVSVKGISVAVDATQELKLSGAQIKISGQMVSVEANAQLDIKSSAIANIKGSMVKIN